jgi:hypothetical protein
MTSTTVRFLNGDLVTYPYISPEWVIEAICETYPTAIHPLQVYLYRDCENDQKVDHTHRVVNAIIFPKKRVALDEFQHLLSDTSVNWKALDLDTMTNESVIAHLLTQNLDDIPPQLFANPHPLVVDFLHTSGIFRLDQTETEVNEWFNAESERTRYIFSNPSDRISEVFDKVGPPSLFQKYQTWIEHNHEVDDHLLWMLGGMILTHPLSTKEMMEVVVQDIQEHPLPHQPKHPDCEVTWKFLSDNRHHPEIKSHREFLVTLTELLCDLQYADCDVVF